MTNIDTPDGQRGVVGAQQLLARVGANVAAVTVPVAPNVRALWIDAEGGIDPPPTVVGTTTGTSYPSYNLPLSWLGSNPGLMAIAIVSSAIDNEVTVTCTPTPGTPWYVVGDTGDQFTLDAVLLGVSGIAGLAVPDSALLVAGSDGTDLRVLLTDSTGKLEVSGGFPASVYGVPGAAAPADAVQVGGSDGVDLRALLTDSTGKLLTVDQQLKLAMAAAGAAAPADVVQVGSSDGVHLQPLHLTSSGELYTIDKGLAAALALLGAAIPAEALQVGGSDGVDLRALLTDSTGKLLTVDQQLKLAMAVLGAAIPADAVLLGGSDGTDLRALRTNQQGAPYAIPSAPDTATGDRPPVELQIASVIGAVANTVIVAAPGAGKRIRLFFIDAYPDNAAASFAVLGNDVNGVQWQLPRAIFPTGVVRSAAHLPLTGFLVQTNTAVTLIVAAGEASATVLYTIETV